MVPLTITVNAALLSGVRATCSPVRFNGACIFIFLLLCEDHNNLLSLSYSLDCCHFVGQMQYWEY